MSPAERSVNPAWLVPCAEKTCAFTGAALGAGLASVGRPRASDIALPPHCPVSRSLGSRGLGPVSKAALSSDLTAFARGKNEASGSAAGAPSALERRRVRARLVAVQPACWVPHRRPRSLQ